MRFKCWMLGRLALRVGTAVGWMEGRLFRWDGVLRGCEDGAADGDGWMDGWMDGFEDGLLEEGGPVVGSGRAKEMDGWLGEWVEGLINRWNLSRLDTGAPRWVL